MKRLFDAENLQYCKQNLNACINDLCAKRTTILYYQVTQRNFYDQVCGLDQITVFFDLNSFSLPKYKISFFY